MEVPEVLGDRYRLGSVLGRGGMAVVRAATDLRLGREVAVKVLHPQLAVDESIRRRFETEARTAARLSHPNIVVIHDTGEDDGLAFIVMERMSGRSLSDEIREGPFSEERAVVVGREILAALNAAHAAGILHRDIKPSNVLVGANGSVKVADFGIATTTDGTSTLTVAGSLVGTPAYLAPERLEGRPATRASDLYSVGALLYEVLAGNRPFEAESSHALLVSIVRDPAPALGHLRPGITPGLVAAVERALAKDPANRHPSAEAMAAALTGAASPSVPSPAGSVTSVQVPVTSVQVPVTSVQGEAGETLQLEDGSGPGDRGVPADASEDLAATVVSAPDSPRAPAPSIAARPTQSQSTSTRRRSLAIAVSLAGALVVVLLLLLLPVSGAPPSRASRSPTTAGHTNGPTQLVGVPAPLARAVIELARAVGS